MPTHLSDLIDQNGIRPGPAKLAQFQQALRHLGVPTLYTQEKLEDQAIALVKFFNPCGSGSWFVMEWDGDDECFGLCHIHEAELGYFSLRELANVPGPMGIGIEIDVWFQPTLITDCRKEIGDRYATAA